MLDILKFGWGGKRLGITISCLPSQVALIFGPRNRFLKLLLLSFFLPCLSLFFSPLRWQQNKFMWRLNMNSVYFLIYHICWIFHNAFIFSSYNIHVGVPVLCLAHTKRSVDLLMILVGWSELQECHLYRMAQLDSWSFFITEGIYFTDGHLSCVIVTLWTQERNSYIRFLSLLTVSVVCVVILFQWLFSIKFFFSGYMT